MAFNFIKRQLLKVIEWKDESQNTILYRFDVPDRYAIMRGSQLTVRESQVCIFVVEGKIADVFTPGRYKLDTENLPVLTALYSWKYAFETPYTGDVYFVNTKQFIDQKWGTSNPIMMRDKDFGMIRLRGYGIYSYKVEDAVKLMRELSGTNQQFKTENIADQLRKMILSTVTDVIAESGIAALDLATQYEELSDSTKTKLVERFEGYGLKLIDFYIENLSLPEEVEKTMDTRTSMGVLGDKMGTYTQYQAAQAMRDAAKNPGTGGTFAGAGIGLGAGIGMAGLFTDAMKNAKDEKPAETATAGTVKCSECGKEVKKGSKFCPECGAKMNEGKFCPECGAKVSADAKFCPECGKKLI